MPFHSPPPISGPQPNSPWFFGFIYLFWRLPGKTLFHRGLENAVIQEEEKFFPAEWSQRATGSSPSSWKQKTEAPAQEQSDMGITSVLRLSLD